MATKTTEPTPVPEARSIRQGDIVDYVLNSGRSKGEHRPAVVVRVWGTLTPKQTPPANLQVFTDGTNDFDHGQPGSLNGLIWATSVPYDEEEKKPGSWHWPEVEN